MSIRTKVLGMVDVMMRVPPILVIDEILKIDMGLPSSSSSSEAITLNISNTTGVLSESFGNLIDGITRDTYLSDLLALTTVKFLLCFLGLLSALCIFMLWTRHLVMVYMFVISLGIVFLSHWTSQSALAVIEKSPHILDDILSMNATRLFGSSGIAVLSQHVAKQWCLGMLFAYIHLGPRFTLIQNALPFIFVSPIFLGFLPLRPRVIKYLPLIADFVPLLLTKMTLWTSSFEAGKTVYNGYQYAMNFVSNFGLSALIENEWQRLKVPSVLRVFWTVRISQAFVSMMLRNEVNSANLLPTMQTLLVDGCGTLTAVLGMTSVISVICHYIGKAFQWYLLTFDNEEEKSLGTASAVLFYMLALQTGLTSLAPDKRFVRLLRNLSLMISALLHFIHNIVSPILMSLSAARNPSRKRHFRALTVCAFLVIAPICLLVALWNRHLPSTWLLAVTAFSVEVVVKVLVSLATYTLFLLDACRQTFWEKLDDYLYYVRAFGNSVEFCFGILLFFNGAWILVFESAQNATGGAIRAIMMCIHAYFNIWCEARAGWSVFMKRRSAVHKISTLPEATTAQLQVFDDVCAICYQEMQSAKITRCRHYFHGVCLRKWLYVQDKCPLCHEIMMYTDRSDDADANAQQQREQAGPDPANNRAENGNRSRSSDEISSSSSAGSLLTASEGNFASGHSLSPQNAATAPTTSALSTTQRRRLSPDIGVRD